MALNDRPPFKRHARDPENRGESPPRRKPTAPLSRAQALIRQRKMAQANANGGQTTSCSSSGPTTGGASKANDKDPTATSKDGGSKTDP
ncbi:uncharacterized protein EHS24_007190 [Apiotrichum porosum]|uniref:Uncharacterized protein n=1 Tax=Apiotrichum porosum TaxID=105984 RepID=A0A427XXE1_9TREE|nr:uncharacterized protein EHS24_007190 [Apiotrichum porosum]RSH83503.1 hypothetical protein EHS24_007190 [Apiotrichum porosum]